MNPIIPPVLGKEVFSGYFFTHKPILIVPEGTIELYASANIQWRKFAQIQSEEPINDIRTEEREQKIIINRDAEKTNIICPISIKEISTYNLQGKTLFHVEFPKQERKYSIPNIQNRIILEIVLSTGEREIVKF